MGRRGGGTGGGGSPNPQRLTSDSIRGVSGKCAGRDVIPDADE